LAGTGIAISHRPPALPEVYDLTQVQLAKKLNSSQSRIAKMEQGDPTVSLDLLVKALMAMGATKKNIAKLIA